jgi:hypothetical protein
MAIVFPPVAALAGGGNGTAGPSLNASSGSSPLGGLPSINLESLQRAVAAVAAKDTFFQMETLKAITGANITAPALEGIAAKQVGFSYGRGGVVGRA